MWIRTFASFFKTDLRNLLIVKLRICGTLLENLGLRRIFDSSLARPTFGMSGFRIYGNPDAENSMLRRIFDSSLPKPTFGKIRIYGTPDNVIRLKFLTRENPTSSSETMFRCIGVDDVVCQLFDPERASSQTGKIS